MRWNLAVAGLATSWGFISVIVVGVTLGPLPLTLFRLVLAAIALAALLAVRGRLDLLRVPGHRGLLVVSGLALAVHWWAYFETIKLAGAAVANFVVYTAPILVALVAPFVLPEARSRVVLAALVPGVGGLALIAFTGGAGGGHVRPLALATGGVGAASYVVLVLSTKGLTARLPAITITFWNCAIATVALLPFLPTAGRVLPHADEWPWVVLLGVVFTGLSGFLYISLLGRVTAQAMGILSYIEPVSAALLTWAILGQSFGWQVAVGGVLVVAAGTLIVVFEPAAADALTQEQLVT
ncbi:MAG: EamA family transporter [Actinobacteria bacterium]|nr:EamA family transporter [Actinomycetota bacterium]